MSSSWHKYFLSDPAELLPVSWVLHKFPWSMCQAEEKRQELESVWVSVVCMCTWPSPAIHKVSPFPPPLFFLAFHRIWKGDLKWGNAFCFDCCYSSARPYVHTLLSPFLQTLHWHKWDTEQSSWSLSYFNPFATPEEGTKGMRSWRPYFFIGGDRSCEPAEWAWRPIYKWIDAGICWEELISARGGAECDSFPNKHSCLQGDYVYNHKSNQKEPDSDFWPYGQEQKLSVYLCTENCCPQMKVAAPKLYVYLAATLAGVLQTSEPRSHSHWTWTLHPAGSQWNEDLGSWAQALGNRHAVVTAQATANAWTTWCKHLTVEA